MRVLTTAVALVALALSACARDNNVRADTEDDTQQELVEAGEAVGEAAVEVGQAARHVIEDAADATEDETQADQPAPTPPQQTSLNGF